MVAAVLGGAGLARVAELAAEAAEAPVAVVIPGLAAVLAATGSPVAIEIPALERLASDRVEGAASPSPSEVVSELPIRLLEEVMGIVVLLRAERPARFEAAEFLYPAAAATVVALAMESARREVQQQLRGALLEELRSGHGLDRAAIVGRAARVGCDLSGGAAILCAEGTMPRRLVSIIAAEHPGALVEQREAPAAGEPARVYAALIPTATAADGQAVLDGAHRLAERLRGQALVGVSSFHADPAELGTAVEEAELMLEVLRHGDVDVATEIGSPTYRLLFRLFASHPDEIRTFYDATIAPAVRYEDQYGIDLLGTLEAYLACNGNVTATAATIFAHRHTVAYRLERLHELTGLDPTHAEHRERLALGLKVHRIVAPRLG